MKYELTLTAWTEWFPGHPPRGAVHGSIARITGCKIRKVKPRKKLMGRNVGGGQRPFGYKRMMMGDTVTIRRESEGLYEVIDAHKRGGCSRRMYVVLWHPDHGMIIGLCHRGEAKKIARRLECGESIEDIVEVRNLRKPPQGDAMVFDPVCSPNS